ncbi:aa3-type cytochrome c oxidase subunit IV [Pseudoroseicyclus aestuarii]|uniref:Aa3 type cytochrome c oxidase subunit IV n=1 Tax=Pseudoroseicyclus aestuarii TaxID=1795041 RepID=A0A318SXU1_9RHOB|nr:aa3-type cytochrome c oxidase subunit IV [Pseudoroseicyclus aestuarii]PYE84657.1 aa3 type cytochrome c oxidase subunit IV [Pseudoroseicyclus aestuarii]
MAEHSHGSMDVRPQERTFEGFIWLVGRAVAVIILLLVLLALINA